MEELSNANKDYCVIALMDSTGLIGDFELDRISSCLRRENKGKARDVLLFLLTRGGEVEPAYQMSKLCKLMSRSKFVVVVPRQAKSAGTLIALGADEIHMGHLGHLGPIDPQLDRLPALGVSHALRSIAAVAQEYPGSSQMLAQYLQRVLTVQQIGYCERVCESAAQYAERLLMTKSTLPRDPKTIAMELVHEYKDHGFVIDIEEARGHLGETWIKSDTVEVAVGEKLYNLYDDASLWMAVHRKKRILIAGSFDERDVLVFNKVE